MMSAWSEPLSAWRARRLTRRYLDPAASWTARDDRALRDLVRASDGARAEYDRFVSAHRLLSGLDRHTPSALERSRLASATVSAALAPGDGTSRSGAVALVGAGAAAALVAALFVAPGSDGDARPAIGPRPSAEYVGTRGPASVDDGTGFGLSAVTASGREVELLAHRAYADDHARFFVRCTDPGLGFAMLFGLDAAGDGVWYFPADAQGASVAVPCGVDEGRHALDEELQLSLLHAPGVIRVVALFSAEALRADRVAAAVFGRVDGRASDSELARQIRERLGLEGADVVRVRTMELSEGARSDGRGD
jgi:hypothetical protein